MAEKLYETLAKQVLLVVNQYREETNKLGQAVQNLNNNPRYTDFGKDELVKKLREELKRLNESETEELKEIVQHFINEYQVIHTDDGRVDPQNVANALKVIEMCGTSLTAEVLRTAIEPVKGSYSTLKMILSIFVSKNENALAVEATYKPECIELLNEYLGINNTICDYEDLFLTVSEVLNMPELVSMSITGTPNYNGVVINNLVDNIPYCTLCLADNMMRVGKLHEQVSLEYPRLFK